MEHIHSVYDSDAHFIINEITRAINGSPLKNSIMQFDHNSERLSFELPRYIEGHDMSLCNKVEVHYINIGVDGNRSEGVCEVNDLQTSADDETIVVCSWLISADATQYAGSLSFLIRFACLTDDVVDYAWHTEIYSGISVGEGMNNGEAFIADNKDVIEAWKAQVEADIKADIKRLEETVETSMNSEMLTLLRSDWNDESDIDTTAKYMRLGYRDTPLGNITTMITDGGGFEVTNTWCHYSFDFTLATAQRVYPRFTGGSNSAFIQPYDFYGMKIYRADDADKVNLMPDDIEEQLWRVQFPTQYPDNDVDVLTDGRRKYIHVYRQSINILHIGAEYMSYDAPVLEAGDYRIEFYMRVSPWVPP